MAFGVWTETPACHLSHRKVVSMPGDLWQGSLCHTGQHPSDQNPAQQLCVLQRNYSKLFLAKRVARKNDTDFPHAAPPGFGDE